jgi:hypothetical protein
MATTDDDTREARHNGGVSRQAPTSTEEREARADEREAALDARQDRADARDAAQTDREEHVRSILLRADERDGDADDRDSAADTRDATASLNSFLNDEEFPATFKARRLAALDRLDSKTDRTSSASDRSDLTEASDTAQPDPDAAD